MRRARASKPVATSGSSSTAPRRGETARRAPARGFAPRRGDGMQGALRTARGPSRPSPRAAIAQSASERAIGPGWSRLHASGTMPASETSPGWLDRRGAAARGGDAQRARGVGARRGRGHPCRERGRRAAARASGRALERPRASDLVGRPACGELVRVKVTEQHHPGGGQALQTSQSSSGTSSSNAARRGHRLARDAVEVLEPDRHTRQRRGRAVPPHGRLAQALVRERGGRERVLLVDAHPGVDRAGVTVVAVRAVDLADPIEQRAGHFSGGDLAPLQAPRQLRDAQPGDVRHDGARKRRGLSIVSSSICASVTPRSRSAGRIVVERWR